MFFRPSNVPFASVSILLSCRDNRFRLAKDESKSLSMHLKELSFSSSSWSWLSSLNRVAGKYLSLLLYNRREFNDCRPPEKANGSIFCRLLLDKSIRCNLFRPWKAFGPKDRILLPARFIRLTSLGKPVGTMIRLLLEQSAICATLLQRHSDGHSFATWLLSPLLLLLLMLLMELAKLVVCDGLNDDTGCATESMRGSSRETPFVVDDICLLRFDDDSARLVK